MSVNPPRLLKRFLILAVLFLASPAIGAESVKACIIPDYLSLNFATRAKIAECLDWKTDTFGICAGHYSPLTVPAVDNKESVYVEADEVTFYNTTEPSRLQGSVRVQQENRIVRAETAWIYRDPVTNNIDKIVLLDNVRLMEPDRLIIANKALIYPKDGSGRLDNILYLLNDQRHNAILPAWGRALSIQRFPNKDFLLEKATYTTCSPKDNAWEIKANRIAIDAATHTGVARDAVLKMRDIPIFYAPYFSFPTNKDRKSGFLIPVPNYSSQGGFDLSVPYYWNIAPNYDATITPHAYSRRGVMMGGLFRYLWPLSQGVLEGNILPKDRAYRRFLDGYSTNFPTLLDKSTDRWNIVALQHTQFSPDLWMDINFQQVSDDYYFQDFSTNLAVATERQLLKEANINYKTENWLFRGMVQGYQTLNPVNESVVAPIYRRLPQLIALGNYTDLPWDSHFRVLSEYDQFFWPGKEERLPEGPRYHINPTFSLPFFNKTWGYATPSVEWVGNFYEIKNHLSWLPRHEQVNHNLARFYVDGGLYLDRDTQLFGEVFRQTLEPRLFYLYVPYENQSDVPAFDSAYMIFNFDQVFRTNRFSGFDRIGDANQLAWGLTSRFISERAGMERALFSIGQIRYFDSRKVRLCYAPDGLCLENPRTLGFLSPEEKWSPIAARGLYRFNPIWSVIGNYIWDPATRTTNNAQVNFHFQPDERRILQLGYTWLANGDDTRVVGNIPQNNALNQATFAWAWPFTQRWSTLGAYGYNISKGYTMMTLAGLQYDSCCWALRLMGGQTFDSINQYNRPEYNNSFYVQFQFKGLGSLATNDPSHVIETWIPGYQDPFAR